MLKIWLFEPIILSLSTSCCLSEWSYHSFSSLSQNLECHLSFFFFFPLSYASILPSSASISTSQALFKPLHFSPHSSAPMMTQVTIICSLGDRAYISLNSVTSALFLPTVFLRGDQDVFEIYMYFILRMIIPEDSR